MQRSAAEHHPGSPSPLRGYQGAQRASYLKHEPDEDAQHEEEADVRMIVDDKLLAEDGVTFPPSESHNVPGI